MRKYHWISGALLIIAIAIYGLSQRPSNVQPLSAIEEFRQHPAPPVIRWPAGSEHLFLDPDPAWKAENRRLKRHPNSFEVLNADAITTASDEIWTESVYRETGQSGLNNWRKLRRWDSHQKLRLEIDKYGENSFYQDFDATGKLKVYEHRRGSTMAPKWIGAVSFDINGFELARVESGSGEIVRTREGDLREHQFIHNGLLYLAKSKNDTIYTVSLIHSVGSLSIDLTATTENLRLNGEQAPNQQWTPGESWSKNEGVAPSLLIGGDVINEDGSTQPSFLDEKTKRRKQELAEDEMGFSSNGPREAIELEMKKRAKQAEVRAALRAAEYPKVRAEFLGQYETYLKAMGKSLESIGVIDAINAIR